MTPSPCSYCMGEYPGLLVCNRWAKGLCKNSEGFVGYNRDYFPMYKRGDGPPVADYGQPKTPLALQSPFLTEYGNTAQNLGSTNSALSQPATLYQPAGSGLVNSLLNTPMAPTQPGRPSQATNVPAPTPIQPIPAGPRKATLAPALAPALPAMAQAQARASIPLKPISDSSAREQAHAAEVQASNLSFNEEMDRRRQQQATGQVPASGFGEYVTQYGQAYSQEPVQDEPIGRGSARDNQPINPYPNPPQPLQNFDGSQGGRYRYIQPRGSGSGSGPDGQYGGGTGNQRSYTDSNAPRDRSRGRSSDRSGDGCKSGNTGRSNSKQVTQGSKGRRDPSSGSTKSISADVLNEQMEKTSLGDNGNGMSSGSRSSTSRSGSGDSIDGGKSGKGDRPKKRKDKVLPM